MLRAIMIDDEILAIRLLEHLLIERDEIEIVGSYTDVDEGLKRYGTETGYSFS